MTVLHMHVECPSESSLTWKYFYFIAPTQKLLWVYVWTHSVTNILLFLWATVDIILGNLIVFIYIEKCCMDKTFHFNQFLFEGLLLPKTFTDGDKSSRCLTDMQMTHLVFFLGTETTRTCFKGSTMLYLRIRVCEPESVGHESRLLLHLNTIINYSYCIR